MRVILLGKLPDWVVEIWEMPVHSTMRKPREEWNFKNGRRE